MPSTSLKISETASSNLTSSVTNASVNSMQTDSSGGSDETSWQNYDWDKYWGYFNTIPELKSAIIMKAIWCVGKGWTADPETTIILEHISGWGKDTFDDILFNMKIQSLIGGDAYAEIIRGDDKAETLINLKPLNPGRMRHIVDKKGILKRYEQIKENGEIIKFKPEDIFHLSHNRLADQIHGISDIVAMEKTILAEYESFEDLRKIQHRQARPMILFKLGTDDPVKITNFITKMDAAVNKGENIYIPDDTNSVGLEVIQVNVSNSVFQWRQDIQNKFYRAVGMPLVLFGQAGTTESGGKIEYLGHEQVFEKDQRFLENQIWKQLNLRINLIPPVSLLENLQADESKDMSMMGTPQGMEFQPNDMMAGKEMMQNAR